MNAIENMLYVELRQTEKEIISSLRKKKMDDWLKKIVEDELTDVRSAIHKVKNGCFGRCELSGELFPQELLAMMPTIKTKEDLQTIGSYCRKSIH